MFYALQKTPFLWVTPIYFARIVHTHSDNISSFFFCRSYWILQAYWNAFTWMPFTNFPIEKHWLSHCLTWKHENWYFPAEKSNLNEKNFTCKIIFHAIKKLYFFSRGTQKIPLFFLALLQSRNGKVLLFCDWIRREKTLEWSFIAGELYNFRFIACDSGSEQRRCGIDMSHIVIILTEMIAMHSYTYMRKKHKMWRS